MITAAPALRKLMTLVETASQHSLLDQIADILVAQPYSPYGHYTVPTSLYLAINDALSEPSLSVEDRAALKPFRETSPYVLDGYRRNRDATSTVSVPLSPAAKRKLLVQAGVLLVPTPPEKNPKPGQDGHVYYDQKNGMRVFHTNFIAGLRMKHRFPAIRERFSSPMMRVENLRFVYGGRHAEMCEAVLDGLKPVGLMSILKKEGVGSHRRSDLELLEQFRDRGGLVTEDHDPKSWDGADHYRIAATNDPIDQIFDMDALLADYRVWASMAPPIRGAWTDIEQEVREMATSGLLDFPIDAHWRSAANIIMTGLLLGFPHHTTAAHLWFTAD